MTATFNVVRSVLIAAPAARILAEIADLRRHPAWSPFAKPDPKTTSAIEGGPGAGQSHAFSGGRSGAGRLTIDSVTPSRVEMTLAMRAPVRAVNAVAFTLTPEPTGTRVSWSMTGPLTLVGRLINLFIDCDAMCGKMFEAGLAELKRLAETDDARLAA